MVSDGLGAVGSGSDVSNDPGGVPRHGGMPSGMQGARGGRGDPLRCRPLRTRGASMRPQEPRRPEGSHLRVPQPRHARHPHRPPFPATLGHTHAPLRVSPPRETETGREGATGSPPCDPAPSRAGPGGQTQEGRAPRSGRSHDRTLHLAAPLTPPCPAAVDHPRPRGRPHGSPACLPTPGDKGKERGHREHLTHPAAPPHPDTTSRRGSSPSERPPPRVLRVPPHPRRLDKEGRAARNRPHRRGRRMCPAAARSFTRAPTPPRPCRQLSVLLVVLPVPVPPPQVTALPSTAADELPSPCALHFTRPHSPGHPARNECLHAGEGDIWEKCS